MTIGLQLEPFSKPLQRADGRHCYLYERVWFYKNGPVIRGIKYRGIGLSGTPLKDSNAQPLSTKSLTMAPGEAESSFLQNTLTPEIQNNAGT